jgi:16S rRNA (cytidine1402-2'-O)-methyltransferase
MPGILYIVPTPIGNLADITLRAIEVLKAVPLIAAEDTRTSRRLLDHHGIATAMTSYHDFSSPASLERLLGHLASGSDLALISDAGTPGINDPSYRLVNGAIAQGNTVIPLPGATSIIPALVGSGLPTDRFLFLGFVPRKKGRQTFLAELVERPETCIFLESPHRLPDTLERLAAVIPERPLVIARELSKIHEEFLRLTVAAMRTHFQEHAVRGEFVLLLEGKALEGKRRRRQAEDTGEEDDDT